MTMAIVNIAGFFFALTTLYVLKLWLDKRRKLPLPPGPMGYPVIGNVYDAPHHYTWLEYANWARKYGDICSYSIFGNKTIVLNSLEDVIELLEKRSFNYSDRPGMIMANELMGWEWDFAHMHYSDRWRQHRRMFHQYFQPRNMTSYHPIQKKMVHIFLEQLLESPDKFLAHIRQYVGAVVLQAAYGYEVKTENDLYINIAQAAMESLTTSVHSNYLVESVPVLKFIPEWFPGAVFKRIAKIGAQRSHDLRTIPFDATKKAMAEGSTLKCFVYDNIEKAKSDQGTNFTEQEEIVKNCAAIIYVAGSDTTASLLLAWILAMALNPDALKRGQAEVDTILEQSRLPDFCDRGLMPYVEAMLLETMRWFTITPQALPHRTLKEDEYKGFRIPAGSTIIPNAWAILHDEKIYPDPMKFKPERFLKNGVICFDDQPDPLLAGSFGYGRRNCPGRYLALNTGWLGIVSILATIDISKAIDKEGRIIQPKVEYTDGLVCHPKPYQVRLTARFDGATDLIQSAKNLDNSNR